MMRLGDDWTIQGGLPVSAMLISLQGLANQEAPRLFFVYPEDWVWTFTQANADFYRDRYEITFNELQTPEQALQTLGEHADGYVVWDTDERTSLIVAFTLAGLENGIVVSEALIPMAEAAGLPLIDDFRGRFTGQSDYEIYSWAYDEYWDRTSKEFIVWMGGFHGERMEPGIADWGIYQKAFFTDLSADPADTLEYRMHHRLLQDMDPRGYVMGWHSYAKDTEGQHVTLVSNYGLRMEGLNSLPNVSFNYQIPTTPDFAYRNNHNVTPGEVVVPEEKVYITAIQTDGIGIGAWLLPGRGDIPYAWETLMNWSWLQPGLLQYFYEDATPNDYFIGVLSGPGYMYPKAIPDDLRPGLIAEAADLMETLDLRVFEIMDYSEGNRLLGNLDLPKEIVDDYYAGMPDAIGFVNGYGPARTYDIRDGVPFVSFEYYLGEHRPAEEAVADLLEMANLNPQRPYFLTLHVRQWSSIEHVKSIFDQLGPEFEVVPLDVFLRMSAAEPTFEIQYKHEGAPEVLN